MALPPVRPESLTYKPRRSTMAWSALFTRRAAAPAPGMLPRGLLGPSPAVREGFRNLVKGGIKAGLRLSRDAQTMFERLREDMADLTAEAQAEIDAEAPAGSEPAADNHVCDGHEHGHSHAGEG